MKKLFIISIVIRMACFQAEAQLLEDTQKRLKTRKVENRGFLFFKNKSKVRTTSGADKQKGQKVAPRHAQRSRPGFKTKGTTPDYSPGSPFKGNKYKISPHYSENPFHRAKYKPAPRYSHGNPFHRADDNVKPRYSNDKNRFLVNNYLRNAFWVRMNGDKQKPKGVRANVRRPKFDKKEKDIWNN